MARTALMSPAHFSRKFRPAYGETPYSDLMPVASSGRRRCCERGCRSPTRASPSAAPRSDRSARASPRSSARRRNPSVTSLVSLVAATAPVNERRPHRTALQNNGTEPRVGTPLRPLLTACPRIRPARAMAPTVVGSLAHRLDAATSVQTLPLVRRPTAERDVTAQDGTSGGPFRRSSDLDSGFDVRASRARRARSDGA